MVDVIAPVPLHRWRLLKRHYNQSALLALAIGKEVKKPVAVDLLERRRATDSQGHLSRKERRENVAGAFVLKKGAAIAGKNVVLVDDVLTSGATVNECARILLKAGAAGVYVLTLARVKAAD
jgi:ComF family protein